MSLKSKIAKGIIGLVEDAVDLAVKKEVAPVAKAAARKAPAVLSARSGTPQAIAKDVFDLAARGGKKSESFADFRARTDGGRRALFDKSKLREVPNVPQTQMLRSAPPQGPSARITDALSNPDVVKGLNDTVERGAGLGGLEWYNTEPLRERVAASPNPAQTYADLMDIVAATSPRSRVPDNIRNASYYNYLQQEGLPLPDKPAAGYGSVAQKLHLQNVKGLRDNGGWNVLRNPKPASFSTNLQGNQNNVTIDTHNFRLPGILSRDPRFLATSVTAEKGSAPLRPQQWFNEGSLSMDDAVNRPVMWDTKPRPNEYAAYEAFQQGQARKLGMSPAQYQASMWVGGGDETGLGSTAEPFLDTFEARVAYTADKLGVTPEALLELVVAGKVPLLARGGRVKSRAA